MPLLHCQIPCSMDVIAMYTLLLIVTFTYNSNYCLADDVYHYMLPRVYFYLFLCAIPDLHWCRNPGLIEMASGSSICVPEPLQHEDARSWFKRFELCAAANEWDAAKQLLRLPTLLRGRSWAIYESLSDDDKETYKKLKKAILERLHPDTDENRLAAREQLSQRRFHCYQLQSG